MEKPNSENPEQLMSDTSDHQDQQRGGGANQSSARSYECTFCKRGFSNAQALGGHMNIHRRDKAKLKQAHETKQHQHQYSSEISKMRIPSYSSPDDPPLYMNPNWFCDQEEESGKGLSSAGRGTSSESEKLDLELRLGPEPPAHDQDSSSSATATRKFF